MKYEHNYARHVTFVRIYLDTVDAYPNDVQSKKKSNKPKYTEKCTEWEHEVGMQ